MKIEFNGINLNFGNFIEKDTDDKKEKSKESDDESEQKQCKDWSRHPIFPYLTYPNHAGELLPRLGVAIALQTQPRERLLLVRSLFESGETKGRLPLNVYSAAYGEMGSSVYSKWMGKENPFSSEEIETALLSIKNIKL